jgi:hypothetical protein
MDDHRGAAAGPPPSRVPYNSSHRPRRAAGEEHRAVGVRGGGRVVGEEMWYGVLAEWWDGGRVVAVDCAAR